MTTLVNIKSQCIGKGYGKLLWNHMVASCKKFGIQGVKIVTSPQAKEFYVKMKEIFLKDDRNIDPCCHRGTMV